MFCPKCSQEQVAETPRFCSRCGFLLTGITRVIENEGEIPIISPSENQTISSPRKKGMKQGLFLLLLTILLTPILMILAKEMQFRPAMFILGLITLFTAGVLRIIYAKMFESDISGEKTSETDNFQNNQISIDDKKTAHALPTPSTSVLDFVPPVQGNWRETEDLLFTSVRDVTTKQLKKD